jgi:hypothetical protein
MGVSRLAAASSSPHLSNLLDQVSQSGHSGASAGIFRMTKQALLPGIDYD